MSSRETELHPAEGLIVAPAGIAEPPPAVTEVRGRFRFHGSLRERAARGTLVNSAFMVAMAGVNLVRALVLAHFLTRGDYGVIGLLVIALGTILWLKQVGIADKYIQQDEHDQEAAFQKAFTFELLITVAFVLVSAASLPLMAIAYGAHQIVLPGLVMLVAFVAAVFQTPMWIFYRRLEYARQRLLQAIEPIVGLAVSVALAVAGAGYWAMVIGITVGVMASAAAATASSPYRLRLRFDRTTFRDYLGFSWPIFVASGSALVIAQAAILTSRWHLGLAATGVVALATTISNYSERVDDIVTGTLYPAICAVKDQSALLYESFVKSNRLALMWAVPFGIALTLFAPDLVQFGLGDRWQPAIGVLQVYGVVAAVNHLGFNWQAYLQAQGNTRPIAVATAGTAVAYLLAGVPLILLFGLPGFAYSTAVLAACLLAFRAYYLRRIFDGSSFLAHCVRAFLPTIPAAVVVLVARALEPSGRTFPIAVAELVGYAVVTIAATWYFESPLLREAFGYLGRRRSPDGATHITPASAA